jgi:glycosyltransferase involved in cell wall biosynthesis
MILALVPAYNEEKRISDVIKQAYRYVQKVVVCDDGSSDSTYSLSVQAGAEVVRHRQNMGYGAALRSLFLRASTLPADAFVTVDSDGQHDASFIPALTEPIIKGEADMMIGSRFLSERLDSTSPVRKMAIKLITRLCDLRDQYGFTDLQSGFRAYNRNALTVTCPLRKGMGASIEIIRRATISRLRIREIPVPIYYNAETTPLLDSALQFFEVLRSTLSSGIPNDRP